MISNDVEIIRNLFRILARETASHPLIVDAIKVKANLIEGLDWNNPDEITQASARLADGIEDWVGYRGDPLDRHIREPYLSGWRKTCYHALLEAYADTIKLASQCTGETTSQ